MTLHWKLLLAVGLGSGLGAVTRLLLSVWLYVPPGTGLPLATLLANLLGSLLIGFYTALTAPDGRWAVRPAIRLLVLGGFCGGFTTFSLFSLESLLLLQQGRGLLALFYLLATLLLSLPGAAFGLWLGHGLQAQKSR